MPSAAPPPDRRAPILVAFDGSPAARVALSWAVTEADAGDRPLRLAHVMRWPVPEIDALRVPTAVHDAGHARRAASAIAAAGVAHCRRMAPDLDVRADALTGDTIELLAELAADSSLLVLGACGQTASPQVLLGSTATELVRRVSVPVAVIRDVTENEHRRPVVIGIDGSGPSGRALRAGLAIAARRRLPVVAVHAWSDLPLEALDLDPVDGERHRGEAVQLLADRLDDVLSRYPGVVVDEVVVLDRPVRALLERADRAALLVVGRHGRAGGGDTPLGSVSHAVLHYAPCPVLLVG